MSAPSPAAGGTSGAHFPAAPPPPGASSPPCDAPLIAANSSRAVHHHTPDARAAAAALEVRYVLEGSVRLGSNRIRVTAHLIDTTTGAQVWSERYDRAIADIFDIQDDIAQHIVAELASEITVAELERVHRQRPVNLSAWDAHLRALPLLRDRTETSNARAADLLRNAIDRAPGLACAWARLSACETQAVYHNWSGLSEARVQRAIELARRAHALDPRGPLALDALASAYHLSSGAGGPILAIPRAPP